MKNLVCKVLFFASLFLNFLMPNLSQADGLFQKVDLTDLIRMSYESCMEQCAEQYDEDIFLELVALIRCKNLCGQNEIIHNVKE